MERASLLAGASSAPASAPGAPLHLAAEPGRVLGLIGPPGSGLTRLGMALIAEHARVGMVACLDVRGWLCPITAWDVGMEPGRHIVVRCPDRQVWPKVAAALIEGFPAVYAEAPVGVADGALRRLGALARTRRSALILRPVGGGLPTGLLHLRLESIGVHWEGVDRGHGALMNRRITVQASGKGMRGIEQTVEVVEDGAHPVRVVPRLATAPAGRAVG